MKTSYTVGAKELAELLAISGGIEDENMEVVDWILDVIGMPKDSGHDWNALSKKEIESGFDKDGMVLCCRDKMRELGCEPMDQSRSMDVLTSWIEAIRIMEQTKITP